MHAFSFTRWHTEKDILKTMLKFSLLRQHPDFMRTMEYSGLKASDYTIDAIRELAKKDETEHAQKKFKVDLMKMAVAQLGGAVLLAHLSITNAIADTALLSSSIDPLINGSLLCFALPLALMGLRDFSDLAAYPQLQKQRMKNLSTILFHAADHRLGLLAHKRLSK